MGVNSNRVEHVACLETTVTISSAEGGVMPPPMQIHKVCLPPKLTTLQKLKHRLTEIFFPDDPLYRCKNQTWFKKLIICLQFFFPIFQWGSEYNVSLLKSDVIAGLTIASLAIPQVRLVTIMHWRLKSFCVWICFFFFCVCHFMKKDWWTKSTQEIIDSSKIKSSAPHEASHVWDPPLFMWKPEAVSNKFPKVILCSAHTLSLLGMMVLFNLVEEWTTGIGFF